MQLDFPRYSVLFINLGDLTTQQRAILAVSSSLFRCSINPLYIQFKNQLHTRIDIKIENL